MMVYMVRSHTWTTTNILERTTNKYSCSIHSFPFFLSFPPDILEHSVWKCQRNVLLLNPVKVNQHFEPHMNNKKWMFFLAECHTSFPTHPPNNPLQPACVKGIQSVTQGGVQESSQPNERPKSQLPCVCVCGFIILWKLLNTYDNVKSGSACISPWWAWNHLYIWSLRCFCFALRHTSRDVGYLPPTTPLFISTPWWWGKNRIRMRPLLFFAFEIQLKLIF